MLEELERVSDEVIQALVQCRTSEIEPLVLRQCALIRDIAAGPAPSDRECLARVLKKVQTQIALSEQAVAVATSMGLLLRGNVGVNMRG